MLFTEVRGGSWSVRTAAFVVEIRGKQNETKNASALCCPPGALNGQIELGSQQAVGPPKKRALLGGWRKGGNNNTTALRY